MSTPAQAITPGELHPAIRRAASTWSSEDSRLLARVAHRALEPMPDDFSDAAWSCSKLGRRGFPFEMTFTDAPAGPRYTLEVDRPDRPAAGRLARALEVAESLGGEDWHAQAMRTLLGLHREHGDRLRYGAWLGVRHRDGSGLGLEIYAELPDPACRSWIESLEAKWGYATWGGARPLLVGVDGKSLEIYYQALTPMAHELPTVLARAGFDAGRAASLRQRLERAYGLPLGRGMPASEVGFSYELGPDPAAGVLAFTLYHEADRVFGGDGSIRRRWIEISANQEATTTYEAVSRPLDGRVGGDLHHGMFGIVVPKAGHPRLALGLTPPSRREIST